jgi:hypothetical protein
LTQISDFDLILPFGMKLWIQQDLMLSV